MHTRGARVIRAFAAASVATFVAAFSHAIGGGTPPSVFGVAASLMLSLAVCTVLTGRTLSRVRLVVAVAISQVLFHALFSGLGTPVLTAHEHGMVQPTLADASGAHVRMWGAHVIAGVVTVVALAYGESAFWRVARTAVLLAARLVRVAVPVPVSAPQSPAPLTPPVPALATRVLSSMTHRGPPTPLVAA